MKSMKMSFDNLWKWSENMLKVTDDDKKVLRYVELCSVTSWLFNKRRESLCSRSD